MTTYYIDAVNGNNANNGLGPDASAATNKPWQTLAKLLGATGFASGDTAYLSPAGPFREVVTVAMTSAVAETSIIGDPGNAQGFKTAAGILVAPGDVIWTAYTTNDISAPSANPNVDLAGRDFLTFRNIVFVGGSGSAGSILRGSTTNSINITARDCAFLGNGASTVIAYTGLADIASNWTIDRCICYNTLPNSIISMTLPTSNVADYDTNFLIQNCVLIGSNNAVAVDISTSGALASKGGGVDVLNCTISGFIVGVRTNGANIATTIPCTVTNSILFSCSTGISAGALGQVVEDWNRIRATTALTNVNVGANSVSTVNQAMLLEIGQALFMGRTLRPFLTPAAGSPLLGFGSGSGGGNSPPVVDVWNRMRPSGGASTNNAVGAYERHDAATQETATTQAGSSAIKLTGPGDHDFQIPVDASATTISVYVRYDTNHGAGNKPQIILLANGSIGIVTETKTATVGTDTWEQLTFAAQTPTAKGIVTVRCVSRAAAGNGIAYFDTEAGGASSSSGFDYFRQGEPIGALVAGGAGGGGIFHSGIFGG